MILVYHLLREVRLQRTVEIVGAHLPGADPAEQLQREGRRLKTFQTHGGQGGPEFEAAA